MKKTSTPIKQPRPKSTAQKATSQKPEAKARSRKPLPTILYPILYSIGFAILAGVYLLGKNADYLFSMQDRGWWTSTSTFWSDCMQVPGGALSWLGAFLTQFFYYPWLGTLLLVALWIGTFWLARCSFRVKDEWSLALYLPMVCLLCSIVQMGYWVYFLKDIDYLFYHSLGLFMAMALSFDYARFLPDRGHLRDGVSIALMLTAALLYWPLGIYSLLAVAIIAAKVLRRGPFGGGIALVAAALVIGLVPYLETMGCTSLRADQPWTIGFHFFQISTIHDTAMELPLVMALLLPLLFPLLQPKEGAVFSRKQTRLSLTVMAALAAGMVGCTEHYNFDDYNYHAEMRMQRAVEEQRWQEVLNEARMAPCNPTREMMMLRDIALINCDDIGSTRYTYNNEAVFPMPASDSIFVRINDQAADLIYYNLGETTFAIRRAIERCMHYGYGYYTLRMLTRCALVNGEEEVAQKYLSLLSKSLFHREWAQQMMPLAQDRKKLEQAEQFRIPLRLYQGGKDDIGTDNQYIELFLIDHLAHSASEDPFVQNVALYYSMLLKDPQIFFAQFLQSLRLNPGKPIPLHYQEAAWFFATQIGYDVKANHGIDIEMIPLDPVRVKQRMARFFQFVQQYARQGLNEEQIGRMLRPEFGDTFWWNYCVLTEEGTN